MHWGTSSGYIAEQAVACWLELCQHLVGSAETHNAVAGSPCEAETSGYQKQWHAAVLRLLLL